MKNRELLCSFLPRLVSPPCYSWGNSVVIISSRLRYYVCLKGRNALIQARKKMHACLQPTCPVPAGAVLPAPWRVSRDKTVCPHNFLHSKPSSQRVLMFTSWNLVFVIENCGLMGFYFTEASFLSPYKFCHWLCCGWRSCEVCLQTRIHRSTV